MNVKERAAEAAKRIEAGRRGLETMARVDARTLARAYAPGKWNGAELYGHLADCDLVYYYRFLKVVAEEGAPIVPFDQDRWVTELRARERPIAVSMACIAGVRVGLAHYLSVLAPDVLERGTVHPERGPMTAIGLAEIAGNHALHHLEQLEAIRDGRTWSAR